MRTLVVTFFVLCGLMSAANADLKIIRVPLFHVSTEAVDHFRGKTLEYEARVTSDCHFDREKPIEVNWLLPSGQIKGLGFGEGAFVKMDINQNQFDKIVGQIKFFERLKIYWPLTIMIAKNSSGQCQTAAFSNQPQGVLQYIKLVKVENPVELLVTSVQEGQSVVQPIKF